jgi:hypothetical protein
MGTCPPTFRPTPEQVCFAARLGRVDTMGVHPPVRPATRRKHLPREQARASHHTLAEFTCIADATS